ncbi:multiple promoter invertase [Halolamina pelagica]|uniref:Multiple promoter invertase n=1 Tax=Halolamina pelagica TaxID=699431 RepID=A0A0P7GQ80_9EURY|nr:recombinase family protein [Halolamina pelagica]KPN30786.1 multiple promoter invertase [Halolamina pelagica]
MPSIAQYHRVSTDEQTLDRQRSATATYAQDTLGADLGELVRYEDKSTGTDTDRSGYLEMMDDVDNDELDVVVAKSVSRLARSIRDLDRTVERIVEENNTELHIIDEGFQIKPGDDDPFQKAMLRLLGVFAELEADMAQQRAKEGLAVRQKEEDYRHGPAPLGFEKDNGHLVEAPHYDEVVAVLHDVATGDLSKRKPAERLDTTRTTIRASINDRPELYNLA